MANEEWEELSPGKIKRLRNLPMYKDKTDEEIQEAMRQRSLERPVSANGAKAYTERFEDKFNALKEEFGLDMNNSNDVETLTLLVRHIIQSENTDKSIIDLQSGNLTEVSIKNLKALGDFQRDLTMSITDLQEKLGISRKTRKEKAADDLPQFIEGILEKAKTLFDRETVIVECQNCNIELIRYWLNFPDLTTQSQFVTECPHCQERVVYNR
jgi:hypothetical protein